MLNFLFFFSEHQFFTMFLGMLLYLFLFFKKKRSDEPPPARKYLLNFRVVCFALMPLPLSQIILLSITIKESNNSDEVLYLWCFSSMIFYLSIGFAALLILFYFFNLFILPRIKGDMIEEEVKEGESKPDLTGNLDERIQQLLDKNKE